MLREMSDSSLQKLLLRSLLWPLVPILLLGVILAYGLAQRAAINAFDSSLLDNARDLSHQIEWIDNSFVLDLPRVAAEMLATNNEDRVIYAVWSPGGARVAGDKLLASSLVPSADKRHEFKDLQLSGKLYRAVLLHRTYDGKNLLIAVAQTTKHRSYLLTEIFLNMLLLGGILVVTSVVVVVSGVRIGLRPVQALRREIASRSTNELQPLSEQFVPIELRPIVQGINELLAKLSASFAGYRRFIADAAHQLRTPLAALGSQLELNLARPPEDVAALLRELLSTTQRTSHLANQLLSLARLEHTDSSALDNISIDLQLLAQEVASDFIPAAARKDIEFEFLMRPLCVRGNLILLRELLRNLFDNAVRYAPLQGLIGVSLQPVGDSALFIIKDNGPGVMASELAKLGTPFHQPPTSLPGGCGLGLAIVREIAHIHHGEVIFKSDGIGSGFQARVSIPLR